jgi:hypothetical protein
MIARSTRLGVERIEERLVPSAVAYGDFNNDGRVDMAAITGATTVTVSLANADGSYTASAILSGPRNQSLTDVYVRDVDGDGNLDVYANSYSSGTWYTHTWLGNGDGTFDSRTTDKFRWPHMGHGGIW